MTGVLLNSIENVPPSRDGSNPPRLIKDSDAPPQLHRIAIEFNDKPKDSTEAKLRTESEVGLSK